MQVDLAAAEAVDRLRRTVEEMGPPDIVVHAAARQPGPYAASEYVRANVLATAHVLQSLEAHPPRQLIYTSTLSVYGCPETNPVSEQHPANGQSVYALTKRWGEQLVERFGDRAAVVILRLPSLYGAGQTDSFIDGLARLARAHQAIELFSRGRVVRDALHVDDAAHAILCCVTVPPQEPHCCLNLGCGRRLTARDYARALVKAMGSRSRLVPVDRPAPQQCDLYADIRAARRLIGFRPTALSTAMRRYADELLAQP